jgi:hypothetical protein
MNKKIDINIQKKEKTIIPSKLIYKNWNITISKADGFYRFRGRMISKTHLDELFGGGICGVTSFYHIPGDVRKYLATFKKELDETDTANFGTLSERKKAWK